MSVIEAARPTSADSAISAVRRKRGGQRWREWAWGYAMIGPTALGLGLFYLWPIVQTIYFSFTTWGVFGGHEWTGLVNYQALLHDAELLTALRNTFIYAALILLGIPLAIVLATLLNVPGLRGLGVYRTLYFLPVITMPAAVAMVWRWIYNGDFGLLNYVLSLVGIKGPYWVADPQYILWAIALVGVWSSIGYNAVIFMAGLQGIPVTLYEQAAIDGAGRVRQFFKITLPLLSPSIFFVSVLTVIGSLQVFDILYLMTDARSFARKGGETIVVLFFDRAFVDNDRGYAAAIAVVLMVIIVALTAIQFRLQKRWVHYD
jgi:multiple sugar transport system permease protein